MIPSNSLSHGAADFPVLHISPKFFPTLLAGSASACRTKRCVTKGVSPLEPQQRLRLCNELLAASRKRFACMTGFEKPRKNILCGIISKD